MYVFAAADSKPKVIAGQWFYPTFTQNAACGCRICCLVCAAKHEVIRAIVLEGSPYLVHGLWTMPHLLPGEENGWCQREHDWKGRCGGCLHTTHTAVFLPPSGLWVPN